MTSTAAPEAAPTHANPHPTEADVDASGAGAAVGKLGADPAQLPQSVVGVVAAQGDSLAQVGDDVA